MVVTLSNTEDTRAVKKHSVLINGQILPFVPLNTNIYELSI